MPWWAGAVIDARDGSRAVWHIGLDLLAGAGLLFLMIGRWQPRLIAFLGRGSAALFVAMLLWDVYSTHLDIADLDDDPELTSRENAWANPAYALPWRASSGRGAEYRVGC